MDYNVTVSSVVRPLLRLVFVGGAVLLGYSVIGAVAGLVVCGILAFFLGLFILIQKTNLGLARRLSKSQATEYYDFSLPITFNQAGNFLYNRVDLLMVGVFLTASAVGIYRVALLVTMILALPQTAFNQLFPPIASRLYHGEEKAELAELYKTVTRWTFTISFAPALGVILYAPEVLSVFGEEFSKGVLVLTFFVFSQIVNNAVGPSGHLLIMSGYQKLAMVNQLAFGILNVVLNYFLIIEFGFVGAAAATASVLATVNSIRVVEIWYLEGIHPYDKSYVKPLVSGAVSAVMMYGVSLFLNGYVQLFTGGALGALSFLFTLYLFGFEEQELKFIRKGRSRIKHILSALGDS
jgi:O-antigen/teichoic acid export membrane protein